MAVYEYACSTCGAAIEFWQSPGVRSPEYCKICNGKLNKIISKTNFHLKGQTWAKDGYTDKREEEEDGR